MPRPHYSRQAGGKHNWSRQAGTGRDDRLIPASQFDSGIPDERMDKWEAGVEKLDESMMKWRLRHHTYVQVGTWHLCDRCGLSWETVFATTRKRIHTKRRIRE